MPKSKPRATKYNHEKELQKLAAHCLDVGVVDVRFRYGAEDEYDSETKVITINKRRASGLQLCYLLHELGHHLVMSHEPTARKFAAIANKEPSENNLREQVMSIEEEVIAWHLGELEGRANNIVVDPDLLSRTKTRCLASYIRSYEMITQVGL